MKIEIYDTTSEAGRIAGKEAGRLIREAIETNSTANIILATGTSQLETLKQLVQEDVDWSKVTMFHLDEYIGLPVSHPASFRKYLQDRFISKTFPLQAAYLIDGETNPEHECERLGELIAQHPVDVALVGIGENGHLAFNDPPADFETEESYIIVELDAACKIQQLSEGWFKTLDEVPAKAISMSIRQIMKSKNIICTVPGKRKAIAVKNCLTQQVNNLYPASILQTHKNCIVYLDKDSSLLMTV